MIATKIEFAVNMTCDSCVKSVKKSLDGVAGIKTVVVNLQSQSVVVESILSTDEIRKHLESTGKKVRVKGYSGDLTAVSILSAGDKNVHGVARFVQITPEICLIDGTVDGLAPGCHNIYIHECGDISKGCESIGDIFNQSQALVSRVYGDIAEVKADESGRSTFRLEDGIIKLSDIIGRSFAIADQKEDGTQGNILACGIIARSAGLFENPKMICACDGVTIWDEEKSKKRAAL